MCKCFGFVKELTEQKNSISQVYMTVLQEQIMPSSLIYSILETSSQSHMAPSPELASVAWKQRSAWWSQNVNMVGRLIGGEKRHYTLIMLCYSGESSRLGTTGWDVCCHRQRHASQSHRPCHHRHCGREESWHLLLWSETCRYSREDRRFSPLFVLVFFKFYACILTHPGPTVEQQTEMARHAGRTLASLHPEQVRTALVSHGTTRLLWERAVLTSLWVGAGSQKENLWV